MIAVLLAAACKPGGEVPVSSRTGASGIYPGGSNETSVQACAKKIYGSPDFSCDCAHADADLPFQYSLSTEKLLLLTEGGALYGMISPWGAHTEPFTGHYNGNHKSDWTAAYVESYEDMTELTPSNQNGICERGETCGVHRSRIAEKQLKYIAPGHRFMVTGVFYQKGKIPSNEFQGEMGYQVEGWACNYRYVLPYIRSVSTVLREKMIATGYEDPHSKTEDGFGNPQSNDFNPDNLIKGSPIVLNKGDEIGMLQIRVETVRGYPDYYKGWGGFGIAPSSTLEFTVSNLSLMDGYDTGVFRLLPERTQDGLLDAFHAEAKKGENSLKFGSHMQNAWLWKAEMVLNASEPDLYGDHSSIFSWTGGWLEIPSTVGCKSWVDAGCDESLAIFKIHKNTPFYESKFYDSPSVSYLVHSRKGAGGLVAGEVLSPSEPDPIQGVLVIKWRSGSTEFQKIAYRVEPKNKRIKIRRGGTSFIASNKIEDPTIPTAVDSCDSENVVCMDHNPNF